MKQFLAVYTGSKVSRVASGWDDLDAGTRASREAAGIQAWHEWMQAHKDCIVHSGGPLGTTKSISNDGIADVTNSLAGFVVIEAESQDAAAAMFRGHPHFAIFPGDAVEVMECLPSPGG